MPMIWHRLYSFEALTEGERNSFLVCLSPMHLHGGNATPAGGKQKLTLWFALADIPHSLNGSGWTRKGQSDRQVSNFQFAKKDMPIIWPWINALVLRIEVILDYTPLAGFLHHLSTFRDRQMYFNVAKNWYMMSAKCPEFLTPLPFSYR